MRPLLIVTLAVAALVAPARAQQLPPELMQMDRQNAELAMETAARGPAAGIPLNGPRDHMLGVMYDQFSIGVLIAKAKRTAGEAVTPDAILESDYWKSRLTVILAFAENCDGKPNRPNAIRVKSDRPVPIQPAMVGEPVSGARSQSLLPGAPMSEGTLLVAYRNLPPNGTTVEIDYDDPVCGGSNRTAAIPIAHIPSRDLATAFAGVKLPAEFASLPSPSTVRLRVVLDPAGKARFPSQVQGPAELGPVAIAAMEARTFPPATTNGRPVPSNMIVTFVFTTTGERAPAAPFVPGTAPPGTIQSTYTTAVPAPPTTSGPPIMTNTTVNGRPAGSQTSDEPGLTAATSKCAIATDPAYGVTAASPVKVGGDFSQGPARERQYLAALRGPNGEGLSYVRRGTTMSPDRQTILDLWEVTYKGLAKPVQIFLDEYHEEPLKAPKGLVCATTLAR